MAVNADAPPIEVHFLDFPNMEINELGARGIGGLWSLTGAALSAFVPAEHQARVAALQIVFIGIVLAVVLVVRPRGLVGESILVSRFLRD
jgi:branched-chain amino acid transport system permease protein